MNATTISPREFQQFQALIYEVAGINLSETKQTLLEGRLSKRLRHLGQESFGDYFRFVTNGSNHDELQTMVDLVTTNETYFFREEKHFDYLREVAAHHQAPEPFRVWSAASSTGEEAYTMCMVLADELGADGNWQIVGSDISLSVLRIAAAAKYDLNRTRGLPAEYLRKYCLKGVRSQEGSFMIDGRLRSHVRFLQQNLKNPDAELGMFDVIFLRNVMIYFDLPTKRLVVSNLLRKLRPQGVLIVGHSETLNGIAENVQLVRPTIYRKI